MPGTLTASRNEGSAPSAETTTLRDDLTPTDVRADVPGGSRAPISAEESGRYELGNELGRGGQSIVFVAYDKHLGREIAFKQITREKREPFAGEDSLSPAELRFVREARVTAQLDHPGIAPIHEVGRRHDGSLYATQKLVRGRTLAAALSQCGSLRERLRLMQPFLGVCQAVAYAHGRGVIHRDLKPSNIMLGELGETVVLDWGLARTSESPSEPVATSAPVESLLDSGLARTQDGTVMGTPQYMSPEQAVGATARVDARSDVWSLGVVLYEILAGKRPFDGPTTTEVLQAVATAPLEPLANVAPESPPELAAVAQRSLSRDPSSRYPSAAELAGDLASWLSGERVVAHDYTSFELLRRFIAKNRTFVLMTAALVTLALASGIALLVRYRAQEHLLAQALLDRSRAAAKELRWNEAAIYAGAARLHEDSAEARWAAAQVGPAEIRLVAQWRMRDSGGQFELTPDGSRFLFAEYSFGIIDVATGEASWFRGLGAVAGGLSFSRDGNAFTAISTRGLTVAALPGARIRWARPGAFPKAAVFSPDGSLLAFDDGGIVIADAIDGSERTRIPEDPVSSLAFSPDGRVLVAAGNGISLWDALSGALRARYPYDAITAWLLRDGRVGWAGRAVAGIRSPMEAAGWTAPGWAAPKGAVSCGARNLVAAISAYDTVLWDFNLRRPLSRLPGVAGSFSADCSTLLTQEEGIVRIWSIGPTEWHGLGTPGQRTSAAVFTPRGALVWEDAAGDRPALRIDDLASGRWVRKEEDPGEQLVALRTSGDGALVAELYRDPLPARHDADQTADAHLRVRSADDLEVLATIPAEVRFTFSADPRLLATVTQAGRLRLWDARTGKLEREVATAALPGALSTTVDFSPDGQRVGIADSNGFFVWDLARAGPVGWLSAGRRESVKAGGFLAADRLVAIDTDGYATLIGPGDTSRTFARANPPTLNLSRSRDSIVLPDRDRLTFWDGNGGHLVDVPVFSTIAGLAVSPDGRTIAVIGDDPAVLLATLRAPRDGDAAADLSRLLQLPSRVFEGSMVVRDLPPSAGGMLSNRGGLDATPLNPGFEDGEAGERPPEWGVPLGIARITAESPFAGKRCAVIEPDRTASSTGSVTADLLQVVDAHDLRGKVVRLSAAVRAKVSGAGYAALWMRVDREGARVGFLGNDLDRITSPEWRKYEIRGRVAPDAEQLFFGVMLFGSGSAWADDFAVEVVP
ncbi:MAG: WD40 repeat domain-containing serine/threonine protein kinase [Myxococcales bacterium]|nr:WD40 repeat domain-containing serine/threonine protein kinase [Myxococcales bacterium]